ncbi:uncharacterized protein BP01DRAFT_97655 [Aspergillus saccharolyticus JOP 1030-1]|uniref:Uncharacterized protein n=1 Tax=Aspergillus saccharolyticus JOP 1030-1 TaxID=1450539 RepID=A0A318Z8P0_9EURO|nr:hypothetical protein BP01DRAFT_97655 [Aspergillus saccharolyticus JOP 1030-1]PYH43705.1 hypothetical protein BP01DRAFT_97655 [Aspergillus saccharolyticus JOP 1030-1]
MYGEDSRLSSKLVLVPGLTRSACSPFPPGPRRRCVRMYQGMVAGGSLLSTLVITSTTPYCVRPAYLSLSYPRQDVATCHPHQQFDTSNPSMQFQQLS